MKTVPLLKRWMIVLGCLALLLFCTRQGEVGESAVIEDQPGLISSPFLPLGSGARAMGMGGAFMAVADDATAASWNPAGLTQLKRPEVSLTGNLFIHQDRSTFDSYPEASTSSGTAKTDLNYFSLVCPGHFLGRTMVFSLNFQHLYHMNIHNRRTWYSPAAQPSSPEGFRITWDQHREGGLRAVSPALAVQIIPSTLALGLTMNFWPGKVGCWDNGWKENLDLTYDSYPFHVISHEKDRYTFSGTNFHFGFRWQVNPVITLGGVIKTPFSARLDHESQRLTRYTFDTGDEEERESEAAQERETLVMPLSCGLGLAARLSDRLTLSLDLYRTEWEKHVLHTSEGTFSAVTGDYAESSKVEPTHTVRLGTEYLIIAPRMIIPFRAGLFYDPDPSKNHPQDFYGFSLGSGLAWKKAAFDLAYQFRFTQNAATISFQGETDHDRIRQHLLYLSAIYYL